MRIADCPFSGRSRNSPTPGAAIWLLALTCLLVSHGSARAADADANWSDAFGVPPGGLGLDGMGYAVIEYGGELIVGGNFFTTGSNSNPSHCRGPT